MNLADQDEDPFAASYMKLHRASQFIDELECERARYEASKPVTAKMIETPEGPQVGLHLAASGLLPGAILGDAVHNIRAALDLAACEMCRRKGKSDKDVYFPFAASADLFEEQISRSKIERAGPEAGTLLRKIAPYRGGNDDLRAIHDLDIMDKHRILLPLSKVTNVQLDATYDIDNPMDAKLAATAEVIYAFPEGTSLDGKEMIAKLREIVELVRSIVGEFVRLSR